MVRALLAVPAINVNLAEICGCTPLSWAADNGHTEIVRALLVMPDIDVNLLDEAGNTPLFYAADSGHTEIVALLNEKIASQNLCLETAHPLLFGEPTCVSHCNLKKKS